MVEILDLTKYTVEDIRNILIDMGLTKKDVDNIKGKSALVQKYESLAIKKEEDLQMVNLTMDDYEAEDSTKDSKEDVGGEDSSVPEPHDPEWHDYVIKQFTKDEMFNSKPTVNGLRRVTEKLLGTIVESTINTIQTPTKENGWRGTVEATVVISSINGVIKFSDVGDVCYYNCEDPYYKHPTSTAATKAEGRALRKALKVKVITPEEDQQNLPEMTQAMLRGEDNITPNQVMLLDKLCRDYDVNLISLANMGECHYGRISDIPYDTAHNIVGFINDNKDKIPETLMGYNANWRETFQ